MIGTRIHDRYQIDSEIGQGGMGTVYKGFDTMLERDIAIKMMTETRLGTEGRNRLLQEAKAVAQFSHPNIITVHDAGEYKKSPFIVMEYIEGINLYQQPPENIEEIVSVIQQVCAALSHAHEHNIIHRDLKPENVILTANGSVKLMDFGLARSVSSRLTSEGTILGTVFYLAPEQAQGKLVDPRSDLYSLGVMLYELTTGELPFLADDPLAVVSQHIHAPVVPPRAKNEHIPTALETLILQLMEKDPADRPVSAQDVLERLSAPEVLNVTALPAEELSVLDRIVRGRLVGREQELRQARQAWQQAISGQGQLLLVSGEPGVGKTRLIREIVTQAEVSGGRSSIGYSYAEGDPPFAPFRKVMGEVIGFLKKSNIEFDEKALVDLVRIIPELRADYPDLPEVEIGDPQTDRQRLIDQVLYLFNLLTRQTPVLLVLEDAHWSDSSTLRLLRQLARSTRSQSLMILVTYREVELDEARALHETLLDFNREKLGTRIKLKRLTRQETHDMLAILFAEEITPEFLEGIFRETEGNPFFIEEVCKAIVESGKLTYQDGGWHRPSMEEVGVPQSIKVAIQSRMRVLSEDAQKTLEQAAVFGRKFSFDLLLKSMEIEEDRLLDSLDEAIFAKLVEETGNDKGGQFAFIHALIPTTIVDNLRSLRRRRLHQRAARVLEALRPEAFEALAYQFIEAGVSKIGVGYLIKAADRARLLFANQEAIQNYEQALEFLREEEEFAAAAKILMKLGLTYHNDFRFSESHHAYDEGFKLWQRAENQISTEVLPPAPHPFRLVSPKPLSMDPTLSRDVGSGILFTNLFSGLVELNLEMEIVPDVANRWEVLDSGLRYVFYLDEKRIWSDGIPLTAHDFEYAWKRALDPEGWAKHWGSAKRLFAIKNAEAYMQGNLPDSSAVGVHARGDYTLEVELERPYSPFLYVTSIESSFPVPRHVVEIEGDTWADPDKLVTNGPFRVVEWHPGEFALLGRDPLYTGSFPGNLDQVEVIFRFGEVNRMDLYQDDRVDIAAIDDPDQYHLLRSKYAEELRMISSLQTQFVGFNLKKPPFDDPRIRKAFVMAVDRDHFAQTTSDLGGIFLPAKGGFLPPGMPGYQSGIALHYDPAQARNLLASAGFPDGRGFPRVDGFVSYFTSHAQNMGFQWRKNLGIEVRWVEMPRVKFFEQVGGRDELHLWSYGYGADFPDPDEILRAGMLQQTGWVNHEFQEILNCAAALTDYTERIRLYQKAEQIIVDESPVFPIGYSKPEFFVKPWVRKFSTSPIRGGYWKYLILEPH